MSEQDNLLKADGKKETDPPKNDDVDLDIETLNEDQPEGPDAGDQTAVNADEDAIEASETETAEEASSVAEEPPVAEDPAATEEVTVESDMEVDATDAPSNGAAEEVADTADGPKEDHMDEIEAANARTAEKESAPEPPAVEKKDYNSMSMEELVDELDALVNSDKIQSVRSQVESIKTIFSSKFGALLAEQKAQFIAEGGNTIDFRFDSPVKKRYNALFKEYREKRQAYYKNLEKTLHENLDIRLEIINEIKGLINVEENINTTYKHFKALQERWRNAGPIPRDKYNNVWNNYHHHVEIFYDFLHLNRDLRDLDFKHNLEQKLKLIERAEELAADNDSNRAFRELQALHKIWKEELGPVDKEHREAIWERFSAATKAIHEKRQAYFEEMDKAYEVNLVKKQEIIEQIKAVTEEEASNHSVWQKRIRTIEALRDEFFKAGKVPIRVNEATWAQFKAAVREFNHKKNAFYKGLKKSQYDNLQKKLELIKIANEHKDSSDFEATTPLMKKIQSDWKSIGHVPRKDSDRIWKEFKTACNHYFNRLHEQRNEENKEESEALAKKMELLDKMKSREFSDDAEKNLDIIKEFIAEWKSIGRVPYGKRFVEGKFNKAVDGLFGKLDLGKQETELLKYDNKLESLQRGTDKRLLDNEHNFLRKKIDEIKAEINQLENNLLFFSNVDDKNPVVKEVHKNIANHKKALGTWEAKLKRIKKFY